MFDAGAMFMKMKYYIVCIFGLMLILLASVFVVKYLYKPKTNIWELHGMFAMRDISYDIQMYYEDSEKDITLEGLVNIMSENDERSMFSLKPSVEPYTSVYDMAYYLFLPKSEEIASGKKVLVGYTNSVLDKRINEMRRFALFIEKGRANVIVYNEEMLQDIVGEEVLREKKPDMYYWHKRPLYLEGQKSKQ